MGIIANNNYRENPDRAVYVVGRIDQSLVDTLTPAINKLRLESAEPITVYIDSPGGNILCAETIRNLATAENQDGERCRLITAVTGKAASAAADLLSLGDYSIAYPHTSILHHGSRQEATGVTVESATLLAASLRRTNEFFATRLARFLFRRLVLRLSQFDSEFTTFREE